MINTKLINVVNFELITVINIEVAKSHLFNFKIITTILRTIHNISTLKFYKILNRTYNNKEILSKDHYSLIKLVL